MYKIQDIKLAYTSKMQYYMVLTHLSLE